MNNDQLGNWKLLRSQLKEKWGKLTEDEVTESESKREYLAGPVQKYYGRNKDEAMTEVNNLFESLN